MRFALTATNSNCVSRIVRCVLALTAWQSPLPYMHCHESACHTPAEAGSWIDEHHHAEHATEIASGHAPDGWHVHWVPLDAGDCPTEGPKPTRQPRLVVDAFASWDTIARFHALAPSLSWASFDRILPTLQAVMPPAKARCIHGFFETFAPEMPLPVRLGVLRC